MTQIQAAKKLTERKREDIIEAAVSEFKTNGFRATSMDQIAACAQVSKRTVYNHFESKEALFQEITRELFNRAMRVSDHPYNPDVPIEIQLTHIAEQEMDLLCSEDFISLARVISSETLSSPELAEASFNEFEEGEIGIVKWISEAADHGQLSVEDPETAGQQFLALIKTFAFWPQMFSCKPVPDKQAQKRIIESAVTMFLNTYSAR